MRGRKAAKTKIQLQYSCGNEKITQALAQLQSGYSPLVDTMHYSLTSCIGKKLPFFVLICIIIEGISAEKMPPSDIHLPGGSLKNRILLFSLALKKCESYVTLQACSFQLSRKQASGGQTASRSAKFPTPDIRGV